MRKVRHWLKKTKKKKTHIHLSEQTLNGASRVIPFADSIGSFCAMCKEQINQYAAYSLVKQDSRLTSTKVSKTLEILQDIQRESPGEKTVIFSQFTSMLDLMQEPLRQSGIKFCRCKRNSVCVFQRPGRLFLCTRWWQHAKLSAWKEPCDVTKGPRVHRDADITEMRVTGVSAFCNSVCKEMLMTSFGSSLNLTAANRVILLDIWWNPAVEGEQ